MTKRLKLAHFDLWQLSVHSEDFCEDDMQLWERGEAVLRGTSIVIIDDVEGEWARV